MNEWIERLRALLRSRSPRERWLLVLAGCVAGVLVLQAFVAGPLQRELERTRGETERLVADLERAARMSRDIRQLRADLALVEARIKPGEKTNLFTLLESLAGQAQIRDQLESIKPKQASGNDRYPETRVEVSIKGATLKQTVEFLYQIESAPVLLIVRSLRIKAREDASQLLDVSFAVSSFERV